MHFQPFFCLYVFNGQAVNRKKENLAFKMCLYIELVEDEALVYL